MSDSAAISSGLGSLLSSGASIAVPNDPEFAGLVARWREYEGPHIAAVVKVSEESDVQKTVGGIPLDLVMNFK